MKYSKIILLFFAALTALHSCKQDDYFVGGNLHDPNVPMSTYDFLASHDKGLFDTLIMLVDRAGIRQKIDQADITFFAPTDYSINLYLERRAAREQLSDPNRRWTVDSLIKYDLGRFADSIDSYIVHRRIGYDELTNNGAVFPLSLQNGRAVISYEETNDPAFGFNENSSVLPKIVMYSYLYGEPPSPLVANQLSASVASRTLVQTSGVVTTTGNLNVLSNQHVLFFYR